uniref:Uncharacterized protein n=1 Tax=Rhizophora mucronata TaxID=61149 RepID=A0A2P2N101_RHIMU
MIEEKTEGLIVLRSLHCCGVEREQTTKVNLV